ncbi:MAG: O-linked N-acetylglucosamine transferase, SPINDLY family protein [Synechococcales bacterium]|nr:O-linked N-acetylglucosamine transferase, SPINDLY family protein [Synechococcales bacterium]
MDRLASQQLDPQQLHQWLQQQRYASVIAHCQQVLAEDASAALPYWFLGLALLLQGDEVAAQTTWMAALLEGDEAEMEGRSRELETILDFQANQQAEVEHYDLAWAIRQHQRELNPTNLENLLKLVLLGTLTKNFTGEDLETWEVIPSLESAVPEEINPTLLLHTLKEALAADPLHPALLKFATACGPIIQNISTSSEPDYQIYIHNYIYVLLVAAAEIAFAANTPLLSVEYAKLGLRLDKDHLEALGYLTAFHQESGQYREAAATAKHMEELAEALPDQIFACVSRLRAIAQMGGQWPEAIALFNQQNQLLQELIAVRPLLDRTTVSRLINPTFIFAYFGDTPTLSRPLQEGLLKLCQDSIRVHGGDRATHYADALTVRRQRHQAAAQAGITRKLRLGYISYCFRSHSVGWLSRWLIQHHDRERFEIYLYMVNYRSRTVDPLQEWFVEQATVTQKLGRDSFEVADCIFKDEVDLLIDLDSVTADVSCEALAFKPAPIQVTWLGCDASGLPAIDYFIADPYVLPDNAQDYYHETIWRLPQTYVAVDGFEVGIPNLRRSDLSIPDDAVVYLSSQTAYKRHPDTMRLQMQILSQVPNSYFLIKGKADQDSIQQAVYQLAEEEGVERDRIRFLPLVQSELIHRANLGIADVVLDTYPYNGATTTLETLWMGIPLVTRVGQQFAARNSYTMMVNAGITEGIAWTDEEYVEWGVRLGCDRALREQIHWKLKQSRQTAPLWNGRQFAREMERAYEQMWATYLEA